MFGIIYIAQYQYMYADLVLQDYFFNGGSVKNKVHVSRLNIPKTKGRAFEMK